MRKLIAAALAAIALPAAAAGEHDGIYMCSYVIPDMARSGQAFFTFHSHPDGTAALIGAAPFRPDLYGYSIGTISGNMYSGTDANGAAVDATIGPAFTFSDYLDVSGIRFNMTYTCLKIF